MLTSELPEFNELPIDQRVEIRTLIEEFGRVETPITKSLERIAQVVGCSTRRCEANITRGKIQKTGTF
jgi:hypothetical protein